jgi:hypothetical protein
MVRNVKDITTPTSGKVREVSIDKQGRLLGFLRLSDWVLVFLLSFGLLTTLSDFVTLLYSERSDLFAPVENILLLDLIVIAVVSFAVYTGWRHIGVIDAKVWRAHTIAFPLLVLLFPMMIAWDLQKGFPYRPEAQVEMVVGWFWPAVIAVGSLCWLVCVLMLQTTRISALDISLVELLARLRRKRHLSNTTRIERVNIPLGILLGTIGVILISPGAFWEPHPTLSNASSLVRAAKFIVMFRTMGMFLLLMARGYFQVRADSLLSADSREPILFLRSFDDDDKGDTKKPTLALLDFSLETRLSNHFRHYGPFIAVGSSKESVTTPGAARVVLSDSEWQDQVTDWIHKSALIVMYSGKTHWVNWELAKVIEAGRVPNLILLIPEGVVDIAARISQLKIVFANTAWHGSLEKLSDFQNVRALKFVSDGSIIIITSTKRNRDAYHLAALVAHYLIVGKLVFFEREFAAGSNKRLEFGKLKRALAAAKTHSCRASNKFDGETPCAFRPALDGNVTGIQLKPRASDIAA